MKEIGRSAVAKKNRYKVVVGEPGCHVVTPIEGGQPTCENPPLALAPSAPSSLPAVIPEESKAVLLSRNDETAHYRYNVIKFFLEAEASQKEKLRSEIMDQFLSAYNIGHLFPDLHKKLGHISRPTLYRWLKVFNEEGIENLAPQIGRKGISVITEPEKNLLLTILLHQNRIKVGHAIRLTKYILAQKDISSPSCDRTLRRYIDEFRKEHYDLWTLKREGEKALDDKVLPYIERDRNLIEVGEGLVADGHRLNFQVINPFTGKPCRAAMVLFWDWRSSFPLGWELMLEENVQCIATAFRNAILTLGKIPKWVLMDNGKAFKAQIFTSDLNLTETEIMGMFARLDVNTHFAWPYNAKSKPIERFFGVFTEWFERLMPSFIGSSIEDKPAYLKRNEKLAQSAHDPWIPEIPEVNDLMYQWREFYIDQSSRGLGGKTPRDIFEAGKGPGVDPAELTYLMMPREIKNIGRNGIDLFGCYWYDEALYGLRDQVIIKYSLSNLSQIYCFYKNEFLCMLKPRPKTHPMASESGTPKDLEDVKRMIAQKKSLKNQTVKLYRLLGKKQDQLPWKEIVQEIPNVVEAIEKEEAEKPKAKFISPFSDNPADGEHCVEAPEEVKPRMAADMGSPLSCPLFKSNWEMYDWYFVQNPEKFNVADLGHIDWLEDGYFGKHLSEKSGQSRLKYMLCKRPGESNPDGDDEDGQGKREDYRLGCDPAIENRWREIKSFITVDPISGLSHPAGGLPEDDERTWYEFCRGIEKRFPGTLNDADWKKIAQYEATREWEFIFHEYEIYRLDRPITE
jgi:putative transposase